MAIYKYLKTFESFHESIELKLYRVSYLDGDDLKIIYNGVDFNDAINYYNNFNESYLNNDTIGEYSNFDNSYYIVLELEEKVNIYEWINIEDDINDYPIEDYYDNHLYYRFIEDGEYKSIRNKSIEVPLSIKNKKLHRLENNLKSDIISYIKSITVENKYAAFLNSTFYALKKYKDGYIMFRVGDHFFNIYNVELGKNVLYNYIENLPKYNSYKNIYGFISINILNGRNSDYKGFRNDFKRWVETHDNIKNLVKYIDIDTKTDYYGNWQDDLNDMISDIEVEIDNTILNDHFNNNE